MKINFFATIFALIVGLLSLAVSAHCQQAGSVAIAAAIRPESSKVSTELEGDQAGAVAVAAVIRSENAKSELDEFAECVSKMRDSGASYKEASKDCREYRKVLAKESTRIANEAADATKASRPVVMSPYYGYSGYGYGYRTYYPRRTVVVRPAAPPRPAPAPRPAAPPRPVPNR